jgi:Cellulase (glycosyl hydrolase family 5).
MLRAVILLLSCVLGNAQNGPTPSPHGALHVKGKSIVDDDSRAIILKGTQMSGLQAANLAPAMTATTFSTIRLRWNMNALRLPVSVLLGLRDPAYLPRVATIVRQANQIGLVVILAASEDTGTDLPTPAMLEFWKQWAAAFKEDAMVIFDVFNQPRALHIPGHAQGTHSPSDWRFWRDGGIAKNGQRTVGMQQLVNVIRSAGASQVIAVMGFGDSPEFQGFRRPPSSTIPISSTKCTRITVRTPWTMIAMRTSDSSPTGSPCLQASGG